MICSFMFQVRSEAVGVRQQKDADAVGRALKCSDERLAAHAHVCFAVHAEAGLCAAGICVQPRRVEANCLYSNIELSEATEGVTAAEIDDAKKRKGYLANAVNVWKRDRTGFYI